jgi:hypothetical protein
MPLNQDERERQLGDLRKEIGGKLDLDDKDAKTRLKDHYQKQFSKSIDDAKTARRRGDSSMARWHEKLASDVHDIIKLLE